MWRYQTDERSGREELWQPKVQQDHAGMYGVGSTSPHRMSFAWRSDNAALKQPEVQPMPTGTPYSDAYWRTQPTSDRWQFSTSMLPFQSSDFTSQYCTDSASASARDPDCSFQAAQVCYPQYNLMESQWQSPNNHCFSFQRHRSALQQPAQFDSALTAALSLTAAAGPTCSSFDYHMPQEEQHQESLPPQTGRRRTHSAAMRCLSGLQQLSMSEHPDLSGSLPLRCSSVLRSDQFPEAAAVAASMWPSNANPQDTSPDDVLPGSCSTQASGLNDLTPDDLPAVLKEFTATSLLHSSPESQCSKGEPDWSPEEQPSKVVFRKTKNKLDHVTVEFLQKHNCFDMPLADAAKSLDIGLSVMKRLCRNLGLARWPYRTRSSLRAVIEKTERYLV
ncbi:hypothetical protein ABBQ32_005702 [Trebouxia sp. C0010 RCD-2024]